MIKEYYQWVQHLKERNNRAWSLAYKVSKFIVNIVYPITQLGESKNGIDESSDIIVSLTSFPERISCVWITIATLLNQSLRPQRVILWLAEDQFLEKKLPKALLKMEKRGLEIRYCDDLKPHKKYFYTLQEYPDAIIITADDDIFYPEDHLEKLVAAAKESPNTIICHWSHQISYSVMDKFGSYSTWENNNKSEASYSLIPIGCNGVLYPPKSLDYRIFDVNTLREKALFTDDLWLKCMSLLNGTKAKNCNNTPLIYFNNILTLKNGLWKENTKNLVRNDKVWSELMRIYPEAEERIKIEVESMNQGGGNEQKKIS